LSIIIAVLIFGVIILVHELGHYFAARKVGILVEEFAIGMGPKIFSVTKGDTVYSLRLFPLGGFCKMLGEDEATYNPRSFNSKTVGQRAFTLSMGVVLNLILAFVIFTLLALFFGYTSPEISGFAPNSNAAASALQPGDVITRIGNSRVTTSGHVAIAFNETGGRPVDIQVRRGRETFVTTIIPTQLEQRYMLGVALGGQNATQIAGFTQNSAAEAAGLLPGDVITQIENFRITSNVDLADALREVGGNPATVQVLRGETTITTSITPILHPPTYSMGILLKEYGGFYNNSIPMGNILGHIANGFLQILFWVELTIIGVVRLFTFRLSADDLAGPIMIVSVMNEAYTATIAQSLSTAIRTMATYMAIISANLGVMNLLPIPALDGGRLVFLGIEKIRKKPIPPEREGLVHLIGFAALIGFAIFIAFNDIQNLL